MSVLDLELSDITVKNILANQEKWKKIQEGHPE
jgi:hypothetical protein